MMRKLRRAENGVGRQHGDVKPKRTMADAVRKVPRGLGFRVYGLGFRIQGLGLRVQGLGARA